MDIDEFKKRDLYRLLAKMSSELEKRGHGGSDIFIYGGAALVLRDHFRVAASDIDIFVGGKNDVHVLFQDVRDTITTELDQKFYRIYNPSWLDVNRHDLSALVSERDTHFDRVDIPPDPKNPAQPTTTFYVMKPDVQLALKLTRLFADNRDIEDMAHLADTAGVKNAGDLKALWAKHSGKLTDDHKTGVNNAWIEDRWDRIEKFRQQQSGAKP